MGLVGYSVTSVLSSPHPPLTSFAPEEWMEWGVDHGRHDQTERKNEEMSE